MTITQEVFDNAFRAVRKFLDRSFGVFDARIEAVERRLADLEARQAQEGDRK